LTEGLLGAEVFRGVTLYLATFRRALTPTLVPGGEGKSRATHVQVLKVPEG